VSNQDDDDDGDDDDDDDDDDDGYFDDGDDDDDDDYFDDGDDDGEDDDSIFWGWKKVFMFFFWLKLLLVGALAEGPIMKVVYTVKWAANGLAPVRPQVVLLQDLELPAGRGVALC